jgi:hypothetical protein
LIIEDIDLLHVTVAKLEIIAMNFFKSTLSIQVCHFIFDATRKFFEITLRHRDLYESNGSCPCFLILAILMGQALMVRILKGPCATFVDQELGSKLYLEMSEFLISCSIEKGDASERGSKLAEQLFKSDKIFKDENGTVDVNLHVRDKLSSSLMADMVLRWKNLRSTSNLNNNITPSFSSGMT